MAILENGFIALFVLWSVASVCYEIRRWRPRRFLHRINWFSMWVRWALFNSEDPGVRPAYFEVEYRDRRADGSASPWTVGMTSFFWSWRSALWAPEQRLADGVHRLGRAINRCLENPPASADALGAQASIIEAHLRRKAPPPAGTQRDFRVIRRIHSVGPEILYTFTSATHVSGR